MPTLQFKGKNIIWNHHLSVPYHALDDVSKLSYKSEKANGNLIIEGDNLLALKALLPLYAGQIKCIYIDPPYNTGNESWVYNDNVSSPLLKEWFGKEVAKDDLTRHDKWLCMITPRLKLLNELLTSDGTIFISIDDNEVHNLRNLMDEIFGEENFVACVANVNNPKGRSDEGDIATAHEYLLIYKKGQGKLGGWLPEEKVLKRYRKEASDGRKWREIDLRKTGDNDRKEDRENLYYYFLYNEKTKDFYPTREEKIPKGYIQIKPLREDNSLGNWRWELDTAEEKLDTLFPKLMPKRKVWSVFEMDYLQPDERIKPISAWMTKDVNSERGTEQFIELGFDKKDFPRPKPIGVIKRVLEIGTSIDGNDIVLDCTAGSGTTAQALLDQNESDGGNRKFILVQMTEATPDEPKKNICKDVTRERVKRAIDKFGYKSGFEYMRVGLPMDAESLLSGKLPAVEHFGSYIFYLCTGEKTSKPVKKIEKNLYLAGSQGNVDIYLIYSQDFEELTRLALNLDMAEKIATSQQKRYIVYAPACFLDEDYLRSKQIEFVNIPYGLFQRKGN